MATDGSRDPVGLVPPARRSEPWLSVLRTRLAPRRGARGPGDHGSRRAGGRWSARSSPRTSPNALRDADRSPSRPRRSPLGGDVLGRDVLTRVLVRRLAAAAHWRRAATADRRRARRRRRASRPRTCAGWPDGDRHAQRRRDARVPAAGVRPVAAEPCSGPKSWLIVVAVGAVPRPAGRPGDPLGHPRRRRTGLRQGRRAAGACGRPRSWPRRSCPT